MIAPLLLRPCQKKVDGAVATEGEAREREGLAMGRLRKVMEVKQKIMDADVCDVRRGARAIVVFGSLARGIVGLAAGCYLLLIWLPACSRVYKY